MNSKRRVEFPQGEFTSPEDFKKRAPTKSMILWADPPVTKSALNHRLRKLVELGNPGEKE